MALTPATKVNYTTCRVKIPAKLIRTFSQTLICVKIPVKMLTNFTADGIILKIMTDIRRHYLDQVLKVLPTDEIKVITGVRRAGKSYLLHQLEQILRRDSHNNVMSINFASFDFQDLMTAANLHAYVENHYLPRKTNYVFIDEIQECADFEHALRSLHASGKYRLCITGSNAFLLSSDLATLFTGRTYSIPIFPFSLSEYARFFQLRDPMSAFNRYWREGGFAGCYDYPDLEDKRRYVSEVFDTIVTRDIQKRFALKQTTTLRSLADFMLDNIANLTNPTKIANTFKSNGRDVSRNTIEKYLEALCQAFVFYRVRRFDIRGKMYLNSQDKYYLVDQSFRFAILGREQLDHGRVLENMVAVELLRRGFEIFVGQMRGFEIDFVASKDEQKYYIQVADDITRIETLTRETRSLLALANAYPKILLASTHHDDYLLDGIKVIDIARWLFGDTDFS